MLRRDCDVDAQVCLTLCSPWGVLEGQVGSRLLMFASV